MFIFKKRVGYFLFFHSRKCLMKTKGSHITHNVQGLGAVERQPVRWENCAKPVLAVRAGLLTIKLK